MKVNFLKAFVLIVALIWPAIHMFVVDCKHISPWELGGWGMYAVPPITKIRHIVIERRYHDESDNLQIHRLANMLYLKASRLEVELIEQSISQDMRRYFIRRYLSELSHTYCKFPTKSNRDKLDKGLKAYGLTAPYKIILYQKRYFAQERSISELVLIESDITK